MKYLCFYHFPCADGFGSAWAIRHALGEDKLEFVPASHGMDVPDVTGRDVIILDFSFKKDDFAKLVEQANTVLVLDHHKSAETELIDWVGTHHKVEIVFDMKRSGAGITWDYFSSSPRPMLINAIEDSDLYKFDLPHTKEISQNVMSYPFDFKVWDIIHSKLQDERECKLFIMEGEAILRSHNRNVDQLVKYARRIDMFGYNVPICNVSPMYVSDVGHILAKDEKFAVLYYDSAGKRSFSLRSDDNGLNVDELAVQHGGGGHAHAASFRMPIGYMF